MNQKLSFKLIAVAVAVAGAFLFASPSQAQLTFHVDVATSQLVGNPSAPFSVDFQLNSGNTLGNNTASISNFTFGGMGAPFGAPNTLGGASGSLPGPINLTDSGAFNEFYQSLTAGSTLGFDVTLSLNMDAGPTPDAFSFTLLDNSLANITTNGVGDSLVLVNINSGTPTVQTFHGTGAYDGITVTATVVPEPSTIALLAVTGLGVVIYGRKVAARRGA